MASPLPWHRTSRGPAGFPWRLKVMTVSWSTGTSRVESGSGIFHALAVASVKSLVSPAILRWIDGVFTRIEIRTHQTRGATQPAGTQTRSNVVTTIVFWTRFTDAVEAA